LLLRHLLVLLGTVFRVCRAFLRRTFAAHRGVAGEVAHRLLSAAQQSVEKSHLPSSLSPGTAARRSIRQRQPKSEARESVRAGEP
jgi:hypothetical protein